MVHHREVSIAVCGIVVGTMLGAGSILLGRDITASVIEADEQFVSYREGFIVEDQYRKRAIVEQEKRTRPRAGLMRPQKLAPVQVEEAIVLDPAECVQKIRYAKEIRGFVIPLIPGRAIDQLVRSSMQDAFDAYEADCLPYYEDWKAASQAVEVEVEFEVETGTVFDDDDRYCNRYTGSRRSRCIVEQRENQNRYQGHR